MTRTSAAELGMPMCHYAFVRAGPSPHRWSRVGPSIVVCASAFSCERRARALAPLNSASLRKPRAQRSANLVTLPDNVERRRLRLHRCRRLSCSCGCGGCCSCLPLSPYSLFLRITLLLKKCFHTHALLLVARGLCLTPLVLPLLGLPLGRCVLVHEWHTWWRLGLHWVRSPLGAIPVNIHGDPSGIVARIWPNRTFLKITGSHSGHQ